MASSQVLSLLTASLRGEAADFPAFQTLSLRLGRALKQANSATLEAVAASLSTSDFDPSHVEQVRQFLASPSEAPLRLTPPAGLLPPPWLQDSEFTPLRTRTASLFDQVDEDYAAKVIASVHGFHRLANPLEAAAKRHLRHVFEGAVKDEVRKAAAVLSPSAEKATLTTALLRLGLNATASRPDLQTTLLRWKQQAEKQDRYKPLKLTTALLNAAKRPLKAALAVTMTDSHRPAETLDLALLRIGRKPLHTGLRAVVSTARQAQFRHISERLDQLEQLTANPLSPATAFYLWAHRSQLFQRSKEHKVLSLVSALRLLLAKHLSPCFHPANTSNLLKKKAISLIFAGKTEAMRQGLERLRMQTRSQRKDKVKDQLQHMLAQGNKRLRWSLRAWLLRVKADKPKVRLFFALKWAGAKQLRFTLDRLKEEGRDRQAVVRRIVDMARTKEAKLLAFWRALKTQRSTVKRATSFQQAADKLKGLGARRMSEALRLTTQLYPKVRRVVAGLVNGSRLKLQDGWTHWRLFLQFRKTRGDKAQSLLLKAIQPSLRVSFSALGASNDNVKSALRAFALGLQGRQRAAFERWRMGLARQALQTTAQQVKGQQLVRALERAGRKPLRSGLPRKAVVTEREKGLQLQQALRPAPLKALRPPFIRLVSKDESVRKGVKWLGLLFAQGLKETLQRWREATQRRGTETAQQSSLALRFQALLAKAPVRRRKVALDLMTNDQNRLKTALRAIISLGEKKPRLSLQRWKAFCLAQTQQSSLNTLKGQKLQSSLRPVPLRTLHGAYARVVTRASRLSVLFAGLMKRMQKPARKGLKQWRQCLEDLHKRTLTLRIKGGKLTARLLKAAKLPQGQVLSALNDNGVSEVVGKLKGQELRAALQQVPRRQLAAAWLRLTNRGEMLHCRLLDLVAVLKDRPRAALWDWRREAEARTLQKLEAQRKGLTLQSALLHTTLKPKRTAHVALFSDNFKLKNACRALLLAFSLRPKAWLSSWAVTSKARTTLQWTRTASNFQSLLKSPFRKPLASSFSRITDTGKSTRARLLALAWWMRERPKAALKDWKDNCDKRKLRTMQHAAKGLKLQEALSHAVKEQKRRTARFLLGDSFRRKTALRAFLLGFAVTPRLCLQRWTRYATQAKASELETAVYAAQQESKAQKFHRLLLAAGRRPASAVLTQITTKGRGLQRVLLGLAQVMKDSPRAVLREWKQQVETRKRIVLERVRKGTALQHLLLQAALPQKLRAAKFLLGDKFKRKNALRAFLLGFAHRPQGYLRAWAQFAAQAKSAQAAKQLQSAQREAVARKFQTLLLRLPRLPIAAAYSQAVKTNRRPQKLLLGLLKYMKDRPRSALRNWKANGESRVIVYLERMATGQKLQQLLLPAVLGRKRTTARALYPDYSKLKNAIRALILGFGTRPRLSLKRWSDSAAAASREQLRDGIKAGALTTQGQKLQSSLLKVPVRTLKDSYERVVAKDTRLKSALRALLLGLTAGERRLFDRWKAALVKQEAETQEGKVKAQKLQQVLGKTMRKPLRSGLPGKASHTADPRGRQLQTALKQGARPLLRDSFDKLTDQKRLLAARLGGLLLVLKRAPRLAWDAWKSGLAAAAQEKLATQIKAQQLSTGLGLVARKPLAAAFHRIVSPNDVLQKTLTGLVLALKGKPRAVLRNWKGNGETKVLGKAVALQKAAKLQVLLLAASKRPQRSAHSALLSTNSKLKTAMRAVILGLSTKPKYCLARWLKNSIPQPMSLETPKAYKFSKLLFNIARKPLSRFLHSTLERKSVSKSVLQGLVHFLKSQPKSALQTWHLRVNLLLSQRLQSTTKALHLQTLLLHGVHKRLRQAVKRMAEKEARLKGTLRAMGLVFGHRLQRYFDFWRSAKSTWNEYEEGTSTTFTTASEKQHRYTLIPAQTIHIRLLSLIKYMKERPKYALREWKHRGDQQLTSRISYANQGLVLRGCLEKVTGNLQRKTWSRLASDGHWAKAAMRTIVAGFANRAKEYLRRWGKAVVYIPVQAAVLPTAVGPSSPPSAEVMYVPTLPPQSLSRLHRFLSCLLVPVSRQQTAALQAVCEHCRTQQALDKLRSAVHILRLAASHESKAAVLWFQAWKGKLESRYQKMNKWVVISFIYNTSVSYQSGFWRWKLVKSHGELIFPHQFSFLRSVARVLNRVQAAALQRSFTLLDMIRHKDRTEPQFTLHLNSARYQSQPSESDEEPTPRSIDVILRNKFTNGEMEMVKRVGAMETFGLLMRAVIGRNLTSAFVSMKDETMMRELKEYNEILMEDLGKLQLGNERLMETFKESTENLEVLSKKLDVMRTDRLVRVLDKIRIELPTFEALLMLKINANISII